MNFPGYANSGGPPSAFSEHQAKCYYEAIEWIAKQPWCSGKVGLNGVSFLAITQFHVAACQAYGGPPPSLCCISPWEGLTDVYRDIFSFGGLPEIGFPTFWWNTEVKPVINGTEEDFVKSEGSVPLDYLRDHPFYDAFWQAKSQHKRMYTHRTGKWVAYYSSEVQKITKNFMDCFLKNDTSSGFLDTPLCDWKFDPALMKSTRSVMKMNGQSLTPNTQTSF